MCVCVSTVYSVLLHDEAIRTYIKVKGPVIIFYTEHAVTDVNLHNTKVLSKTSVMHMHTYTDVGVLDVLTSDLG